MAAIATIAFPASENPVTTNWTTITGNTGCKTSLSVLSPVTAANDCGITWNTAFQEVDSSTETKGVIARATLGGGLETGSKVRIIIEYTDEDNYTFGEVEIGGISVFDDLTNDRARIGKREGGVERWLTATTPQLYRQQDYGDLRHYRVAAGDTISLMKVLDNYVLKLSLTDPLDGVDADDLIIAHEIDGSATAVNLKVGFQFVGGTHTNTCTLMQAALITAKFCATTGSDSAAGCDNAPYLTIKKLMENTAVNQIGFITAGTYSEGVGQGGAAPLNSTTLANGTSWQDAPTFVARGTVKQQTTGSACYYVKGYMNYRYLYNWEMDGLNGASNLIKLTAQAAGGSGLTPHRLRLHRIYGHNANGVGFGSLEFNQGTYYSGVAPYNQDPTTAEFNQYHHIIDCELSDGHNPAAQGTHGVYCESSNNCFEYSQTNDNQGNGIKCFYGTAGGLHNVPVVNRNIVRFHRADGNRYYGILLSGGADNYCHNSSASNCTNGSDGSGFTIGYGAIDNFIWNCKSWGNAAGGFSVEGIFGNQVTGAKFINCTAVGNKYNFYVKTTASPADAQPDDLTWMNCSAYEYTAGGADFYYTAGHATNLTFTNNHATSASTITSSAWLTTNGQVGDPLFQDTSTGDVSLASDSSPLYQTGIDPTTYLDYDFNLRPVPQDSAYEIGAYAYPSPFTGVPINQVDPTYTATVNVSKNLNLTVSHASGAMTAANSEVGTWIKTDNPTHVVVS